MNVSKEAAAIGAAILLMEVAVIVGALQVMSAAGVALSALGASLIVLVWLRRRLR